jgi:hypothetical protein
VSNSKPLDGARALAAVAGIAANSFRSPEEALGAVFEAMRQLLGMRSIFLSQIDTQNRTFRIVAAANASPSWGVAPGDASPLEEHY